MLPAFAEQPPWVIQCVPVRPVKLCTGPKSNPGTHWALLHPGRFCGQAIPQAPQFLGSDLRLASQPSFESLLQSTNPGLHCSVHMLCEQVAMALLFLQALPHPPQLARSVSNFASQPLLALLSQSPKP